MVQANITALVRQLSEGQPGAIDRLMPLLYEELRGIARAQLRQERPGHTLESTALVHEAYLRLLELDQIQWQDRQHFVAVAARAMRRVLIDYARARKRAKRGGGAAFVTLGDALEAPALHVEELIELDETLTRLEEVNQRACRVVECRCFGGLSVEETAHALSTSPATVKRDWVFSRAWLNRELGPRTGGRAAG
ncbi:MAG: sigma-70 family RNA polymerase sigma factor [Longimicrobiales bacterium]